MIEWLYMFASMLFFGVANFRRKNLMIGVEVTEAPFWESLGFLPVLIPVFFLVPLTLVAEQVGHEGLGPAKRMASPGSGTSGMYHSSDMKRSPPLRTKTR